jgi:hypothetical protein
MRFSFLPLIFFISLLFTPAIQHFSLVSHQMPKYASSSDSNCDRLNSGIPCVYKVTEKSGTALLIGDSIATAYADEFVTQSNARGLTAVTMTLAGCAFITRDNSKEPYFQGLAKQFEQKIGENQQSCFQHNQAIINFIKNYSPKKVFLSQHTVDKPDFHPQVSIIDQRNLRLQNIEFLNQISNNLVVVGAPPLLTQNAEIAKRTFFKIFGSKNSIKEKSLQPQYEIEDSFYLRELSYSKINYRSLKEIFCQESFCDVFRNDKWLYFDPSHLSLDGAKLLKDIFA